MTFSLEEKDESTDVFSPKIHLCGEKKRRGVDRKSQRHNTFLFARLSTSTDLLCIRQNGDQTFTSGQAKAGAAHSQQFSVFTLLSLNDKIERQLYT